MIASRQNLWKRNADLVRYIRLVVNALPVGNLAVLQISRLELLRDNGTQFDWPASTQCTATGVGYFPVNETQDKVLDHNVNTKTCPNQLTFPVVFTFDIGKKNAFKVNEFTAWQWWTANDSTSYPHRSPSSFSLQFSKNGEEWITVDSVENYSAPTQNYAIGYQGQIKI